jgi:hypothetical protein
VIPLHHGIGGHHGGRRILTEEMRIEMEGMEKHERWSEGVKNAVLRGSRGFGLGWTGSCDGGIISCEELRVDCVVLHMLALTRGAEGVLHSQRQ